MEPSDEASLRSCEQQYLRLSSEERRADARCQRFVYGISNRKHLWVGSHQHGFRRSLWRAPSLGLEYGQARLAAQLQNGPLGAAPGNGRGCCIRGWNARPGVQRVRCAHGESTVELPGARRRDWCAHLLRGRRPAVHRRHHRLGPRCARRPERPGRDQQNHDGRAPGRDRPRLQAPMTKGSAPGQPALDHAARARAGARGWQSTDDTMTEATSRRGVLLAATGLGAVGLATAAWSEQKGAASKATEIVLPPATDAVSEFKLSIPAGALDGLKTRVAMTRCANKETVSDWSQGVPLEKMKTLADYWRTTYDMRRLEQRLNAVPQFRTQIDALGIHFLHLKSKHSNALPIILTHGWSGSGVEFL